MHYRSLEKILILVTAIALLFLSIVARKNFVIECNIFKKNKLKIVIAYLVNLLNNIFIQKSSHSNDNYLKNELYL